MYKYSCAKINVKKDGTQEDSIQYEGGDKF